MAITPDGWFDWMRREAGPPDKVYSQRNAVDFYVAHSAVGYYGGWASRLFSTARDASGRYTPYAAVSTHGCIPYDGTCVQHYPITASWLGQRQPRGQHARRSVRDRRRRARTRVGAADRIAEGGA